MDQETVKGNETVMSAWSFDSVRMDAAMREEDEEEDDDGEYQRKLTEAIKTMNLTRDNLVS
jgi:hypothetical protein